MYSSIDAYMDAFMELLQGNFDLNSDAEYNTSLAAGSTPPPNVSGGPQGRSTGPTVTTPPPVDNSRNSRVGGGVSDPQGLQALKENRTLMNDLIIENDKLEDCRSVCLMSSCH